MNGIRPTVGIEFDDKYTNAKNKLLDFIKALDELEKMESLSNVAALCLWTNFREFL